MHRREALAVLLGAPLAASACRHLPRRTIAGSIRGGAHDVGHRLRGATVEQASGAPRRVGVVIVGAGPAGLSAAWRLERLGHHDFVIFELEAQAGGTSAFGTDGVCAYPWGAHYVPVPGPENRALVALLGEMGAVTAGPPPEGVEGQLVRQPEERLFVKGRWHEGLFPHALASPEDVRQVRRFTAETSALAGLRDGRGRRAFTLPVGLCSEDADLTRLDRLSAGEWLRDRGYTSDLLRWYVDYACRDDYGLGVDQTSAWAMLFYFASRVTGPEKESAPLLTWPEGNGRIVRHLANVAGTRLRLGQLATDVVPDDAGVDVSVLDTRSGVLGRYRADAVILAIPQFVAARVLRSYRDAMPSHVAAFSYGSWLVANVHLSARPASPGFPFAWDNVLFDSPSLGYVVATHQTLRDLGPSVWTYYQPLIDADPGEARRKLLGLEHREICDAVVADLARAHRGLEEVIERIDVWRWGHAMVRPVPGFLWGEARAKAREPRGRVFFAHSDLSGLALFEEAQYHGIIAAEAVLRHAGREVTSMYAR
jgi:protoporphyrinogen oxidase